MAFVAVHAVMVDGGAFAVPEADRVALVTQLRAKYPPLPNVPGALLFRWRTSAPCSTAATCVVRVC